MATIIKLNAIVTSAKKYHIAEGGQTNEGITLNYLMTDSLDPVTDEHGLQGYKFSKGSVPVTMQDKLQMIPGYYEIACEMGVGSTGQPVLKPVDLHFKSLVKLSFLDAKETNNTSKADNKQAAK